MAHEFADLHDRAGRMEAKGVIRSALQWKNARRFFHGRLVRRMAEERVRDDFKSADGSLPFDAVTAELQTLAGAEFDDDKAFTAWMAVRPHQDRPLTELSTHTPPSLLPCVLKGETGVFCFQNGRDISLLTYPITLLQLLGLPHRRSQRSLISLSKHTHGLV